MGSFCDVVVASTREAKKIAAANGNLGQWPSCSLKGLSHVSFATLYEILTSKSVDEVLSDFDFLHTDESVIVQRFPNAVVKALAQLEKPKLARVAKKWSRTEELEGYKIAELQPFLEELTAIARDAGRTPLLLCVSGF